jgi:DNA polymerase I-like protein with 3'-5' exonuclease and polymerase domains
MTDQVVSTRRIVAAIKKHPFPTDLDVPLGVSIGHGVNWLNAK